MDALHGEAYKACEELMTDPEKLKEADGYKLIFQSLQAIEKVSIVKRTEAFDKFFDQSHRKRGQPVDSYIRQRKQQWNELQDLSEGLQMSEDLRAYFLLKHVGISREDRRTVLLANQSNYTMEGIEKALRTSFYDLHEREKQRDQSGLARSFGRKGGGRGMRSYAVTSEDAASWTAISEETEDLPEEDFEEAYAAEDATEAYEDEAWEEASDLGASGDDEVFTAYSAYRDSRKKLKDVQKARGFYKGDGKGGNAARDMAKQAEKDRSRCGACHRIGHWAGDPECPRTSRTGPKKSFKGGKSKGSSKGRVGKAYMVGESPTFFSLGDVDDEADGFCNMVYGGDEDEAGEMQQDAGQTELDERRKIAKASSPDPAMAPWTGETEGPMVPVPISDLRIHYVNSFEEVTPDGLMKGDLKLRDLQNVREKWELKMAGTKAELQQRLERFFRGEAITQKGYSKLYVQLRLRSAFRPSDLPIAPKVKTKPKAKSSGASSSGGYSKASAADRGKYVVGQMMGNEDCRFFRPSEDCRFFRPSETPRRDPKTNIPVPEEFEVGKASPLVLCHLCERGMVLCRHDVDGHLFFNCPDLEGCNARITFKEGCDRLAGHRLAETMAAKGLWARGGVSFTLRPFCLYGRGKQAEFRPWAQWRFHRQSQGIQEFRVLWQECQWWGRTPIWTVRRWGQWGPHVFARHSLHFLHALKEVAWGVSEDLARWCQLRHDSKQEDLPFRQWTKQPR